LSKSLAGLDCRSASSLAVLLNLQQEIASCDVSKSAGSRRRHAKVASMLHLTASSDLGIVQPSRNNLEHLSVRACQCIVSTRSLQAVFINFKRRSCCGLTCNAEVECMLISHTVRGKTPILTVFQHCTGHCFPDCSTSNIRQSCLLAQASVQKAALPSLSEICACDSTFPSCFSPQAIC